MGKNMKKFNRIAVFIRGHIRMWNYIKNNIFINYSEIADNVDYYMSVWETDTMTTEELRQSFNGQNLIALIHPPLQDRFGGPWYSQGWLPFNLLPYKKIQEEKYGQQYDAVFDQRTDAVLDFSNAANFENMTDIKENVIYSMWHECEPEYPHFKDYGFYCTSDTFDTVTERFAIPHEKDTILEVLLYNYIKSKSIKIEWVANYLNTDNPRPSLLDIICPIEKINIRQTINNNWEEWAATPGDDKIKILKKYKIDVEDYLEKLYESPTDSFRL